MTRPAAWARAYACSFPFLLVTYGVASTLLYERAGGSGVFTVEQPAAPWFHTVWPVFQALWFVLLCVPAPLLTVAWWVDRVRTIREGQRT